MLTLTPVESVALLLSLKVGVVGTLCSLPPALLVAWLLARRRFVGRQLLNGVVHLPLVLPPVVVGFVLLVLFGRRGPIGAWLYDSFGITVAFTWKGAALASAVMGFPLMARAMRLSLEAVDRRLEAAARTLGARRGFAPSVGEFGATITFVSNIPGETQTLPLALYAFTQEPGGDPAAFRLCVIAVIVAMAAL